MNGRPLRAKDVYMDIYSKAQNSISIIDNYIDIRSLHLLQSARRGIEITIYTDNARNYLRRSDCEDFKRERPDLKLKFIKTGRIIHDRFIIIDNEIVYACGASSKDAGSKITVIHEVNDEFIKDSVLSIMRKLSRGSELGLG